METLVATVLIVVVFMAASMILNNFFSNSIHSNTREVNAYMNELRYLYDNKKLKLPYQEGFIEWEVIIESYKKGEMKIIRYEAVNQNVDKIIIKQWYEVE